MVKEGIKIKILLMLSLASVVSFGVNSIARDELKIRYDHSYRNTIEFLKREISTVRKIRSVQLSSATIYSVIPQKSVSAKNAHTEKTFRATPVESLKPEPCDTVTIHDTVPPNCPPPVHDSVLLLHKIHSKPTDIK